MVGGVEVRVLSAAGGGRGHGWWVEVRGLFSLQQVGEGGMVGGVELRVLSATGGGRGHGWWG